MIRAATVTTTTPKIFAPLLVSRNGSGSLTRWFSCKRPSCSAPEGIPALHHRLTGTIAYMSTRMPHNPRLTILCALAAALSISACANHRATNPNPLSVDLAPFVQTRNHAVALVTSAKRTFDPQSINQLMLSYTDLEEKANAYAGFLVESANVDSFDPAKNDAYAAQLRQSINAFNLSYATLSKSAPAPSRVANPWLQDSWVPAFARNAQAYWQRYHNSLAASPQTVAMVTNQIKSETVYPNFEDIATESARPQH